MTEFEIIQQIKELGPYRNIHINLEQDLIKACLGKKETCYFDIVDDKVILIETKTT